MTIQQARTSAADGQEMISKESEELMIAAILQRRPEAQAALLSALEQIVKPDDFALAPTRGLWTLMLSLRDTLSSIDVVGVVDLAKKKDVFIGGADYVVDLFGSPIAQVATDDSLKSAAYRLRDLSMLRRIADSAARTLRACQSGADVEQVLTLIEDEAVSVRRDMESVSTGPQSYGFFADKVMTETAMVSENGGSRETIRLGFDELDGVIELDPATFAVIAARPSMGKTMFALNVAENISVQTYLGKPVMPLIFSLEMRGKPLARRLLSSKSGINLTSLRNATFADAQWTDLAEAMEGAMASTIHIDDTPGLTMAEIRARTRAFVAKYPNAYVVVFIDYLQFISKGARNANSDDRVHVSETSRGCKNLAAELGIPVVVLSQLSRDLEKRASKRPIMSDLRESGAIEQDADIILFIYRDEVYNQSTELKGQAEIIIGKNRDGAVDIKILGYAPERMSFTNYPYAR